MGLSDGVFRSQPLFSQPDLAETIVKAYYGTTEGFKFPTIEGGVDFICFEGEKALDWGDGITIPAAAIAAFDKNVQMLVTYKITDSGSDIQLYDGTWKTKLKFYVDGTEYNADYNPKGSVDASETVSFTFSESVYNNLKTKGLIIHGAKVTINKIVLKGEATGIIPVFITPKSDNTIYNLKGQRVTNPQRGIYIRNGKKFVVK